MPTTYSVADATETSVSYDKTVQVEGDGGTGGGGTTSPTTGQIWPL